MSAAFQAPSVLNEAPENFCGLGFGTISLSSITILNKVFEFKSEAEPDAWHLDFGWVSVLAKRFSISLQLDVAM